MPLADNDAQLRRSWPAAAAGAVAFSLLTASVGGALSSCEVGERPLPNDVASKARIDHGRRLLAQYQCGSCHAIPEVDAARGNAGPSLAAFGKRSYIAGRVPNLPDNLARWIVEPAALVPGTAMPSMGVSQEDARDMAAYLLHLK